MIYPVRSRQSARIVTTKAEKSAEAEVADRETVKAKGRIICNVNQECMFRLSSRRAEEAKRIRAETAKEIERNQSEAEIKKNGR